MNTIAKLIMFYAALTLAGLISQLFPGVPPIGFALFVVGFIPACVALFFAEFG